MYWGDIMTDIEIENSIVKKDISLLATDLEISKDNIVLYGNDKAKIKSVSGNKNGKLILVTAINPTPYGEGKTTVSIGLNDALRKLNLNSIAVIREPSLGPVFGLKGGATGGGYSQVIPSTDINLHFTGDIHAITTANNLLSAAIDNHIYNGNNLEIDEVLFNRCLDINDRSLRKVELQNRNEKFNITAASEIMSVFCLSKDISDLETNLGNIVIGKRKDNSFVYAKELNIEKSLTALLKDAFYPNLVQSLENNPVLIHGGPFANISVGCSSIKSIKLGLSLADYIITEAGFGADLGAEKFIDIVSKKLDKNIDCIVLVATIRALKYYGEGNLEKGCENLIIHINNLLKTNSNIIVALNRFEDDLNSDISYVSKICSDLNVEFEITNSYTDGSSGSIELAKKVVNICEKENQFSRYYNLEDSFEEKLLKLAKEVYHADGVVYSDKSLEKLELIKNNNLSKLPICVAKTQYSITDNKNKLLLNDKYSINVTDIDIYNGAGFITVLLGNILTMPGLPKEPNYESIYLDSELNINGIK